MELRITYCIALVSVPGVVLDGVVPVDPKHPLVVGVGLALLGLATPAQMIAAACVVVSVPSEQGEVDPEDAGTLAVVLGGPDVLLQLT